MSATSNKYCRKTKVTIVRDIMKGTEIRILETGEQETENLASTSKHYYYCYWYSALGPVWGETRVQSGDWYGSGTLHPGKVLRGSLPLLSPAF